MTFSNIVINLIDLGIPYDEVMEMEIGEMMDLIIAKNNMHIWAEEDIEFEHIAREEEERLGKWASTPADWQALINM